MTILVLVLAASRLVGNARFKVKGKAAYSKMLKALFCFALQLKKCKRKFIVYTQKRPKKRCTKIFISQRKN